MFGLMAVTVYAQIYSLFGGVSLIANIVLVIIAAAAFIFSRKELAEFLKKTAPDVKVWKILILAAIVIFMVIGTSRGYFHYDSDLYHGQSIRWIEEYGCVKGIGNLHCRLGYNSSAFAMCALYSFSFLGGQSYHACAGFLALIVMLESLKVLHVFSDKKILASDFARIGAMYYIFNIYDEMVSPASDYYVMLYFAFIVIRLLDIAGSDDRAENMNADLIAYPALLAIFLVTLKLSAAGMVLCVIIPIVSLIKEKRIGKLFVYIGIGMLIVIPFLVRNYLISGWLVYPFTKIDLFDPVWKVPEYVAVNDSDFIIAFGRGYTDVAAAHLPFGEWIRHWISGLGKMDLLLFFASLASFPGLIACIFVRRKKYLLHLTQFSVLITFIMWFFSAPLIRYGQGFLIMLPLAVFGDLFCKAYEKLSGHRIMPVLAGFIIGAFILYKTVMTGVYLKGVIAQPYWISQLDYGKYETYEYDLGDETIFIPVSGDQTGYDAFPSAPLEPDDVRLMGGSISEGLMTLQKN